jgi:hypothetical protein
MKTLLPQKKRSLMTRHESSLLRDDSFISADLDEDNENSNQKNAPLKPEEESKESYEKMF